MGGPGSGRRPGTGHKMPRASIKAKVVKSQFNKSERSKNRIKLAARSFQYDPVIQGKWLNKHVGRRRLK